MAQSYTRQSTFADGDTITASLFNDEYNQLLNAFAYSSSSASSTGHRHDGTAGQGGNIPTLGDLDFLNKITVDGTNNRIGFFVEVSSSAVEQVRIQDGAIVPVTDSDIDLGTSSLEFKDLYIDGTAYVDAINFNGTAITSTAAELNILDGVTSTAAELNIMDGVTATTAELNIMDGVTSTAAELNILDGVTSTAAELNILDGVTSTTAELNILDGVTASTAELNILDGVTSTTAELNALDGITAVVGELNALDLGSTAVGTAIASKAVILDSNKDYTGIRNLTITGDLTIGGDDLVMGTNTAGHLLIADGTNFNPTAVGDLSAISTVANDDVFLAVDTSGGGLKKITRSTLVAGLATSSALSNVVDDSSPQLGGDLDINGNGLVSTSNGNIALTPNGTGVVRIDGNVDIQTGEIVLKNGGSVSNIKFYCESSNAHYTQLQSAAHSAYSGNVTLTLPASTDTLLGRATTDTLTNKTLTSPKINEDVAVTATATELNLLDGVTSTTAELNILDGVTSTAAELNILDGVTSTAAELNLSDGSSAGTIVNSKTVVYGSSGEVNATTLQIAGTSITSTAAELNILDGVTSTTAELNILDGVTSTAAELNILDGVTSTTAELNILDGVTSTAAELNILDGVTSTASELNLVDGSSANTVVNSKAVIYGSSGEVTATQVDITARGDLRLQDSAGGQYVGLQAPATVSSSFVLSLPAADGSANQVLKTDGSGSLGFTTVSSGGFVHLSTITASGASTVDVETTLDATYDAYKLIVTDYTAATDGQQVQILMKIGGSYLTSGYHFASITDDVNQGGRTDRSGSKYSETGDSYIMMGLSYGNDAHATANFVIDIYNPADTAIAHIIRYEGTYFEDDNDIHALQGCGANNTTGALTGLRIKAGSGNISGRFRLYGITNG